MSAVYTLEKTAASRGPSGHASCYALRVRLHHSRNIADDRTPPLSATKIVGSPCTSRFRVKLLETTILFETCMDRAAARSKINLLSVENPFPLKSMPVIGLFFNAFTKNIDVVSLRDPDWNDPGAKGSLHLLSFPVDLLCIRVCGDRARAQSQRSFVKASPRSSILCWRPPISAPELCRSLHA